MSIVSDLLAHKITFAQAASEAVQWGEQIISHDPTLTNDVAVAVSAVKQGASDAVSAADTALGVAVGPAVAAAETALDAALASVTHGASVVLNPFVNDGIDAMAAHIKAAADAWALKAKASLTAK